MSKANIDNNNTNSSCPICPPGQCLCEVKIVDKGGKTSYFLKSKQEINTEGNERLSDTLLFLSPAKFDYEVIGECETFKDDSLDKCVAVYEYEFSEIVDEENSYSGEAYADHYNPIIENKISKRTTGFKYMPMVKTDHKIKYKPDKKVYISLDESQAVEFFMKKPPGIIVGEVFDFMRGVDFLIYGKVTHFPINIHRFGVMECDPDSYKGRAVVTTHYTDMIILPEYEVSLEGEWSFGSEDENKGQSFKIEGEEKTDGKVTRSFELSYKTVKEESKKKGASQNGQFLASIFKLIDSFTRMGLIQKSDKSWEGKDIAEKTKDMLGKRELNPQNLKNRIFPPLYRVGLLPPGLKVAAKAKLTSKEGKLLHINRTLDTPPEDSNLDNPKPVSPDGMYNQPNCSVDAAKKEAEKEKIPEKITEGKGYIHLDPLIAGYISVNFIAMLTRIPKFGAILGAFNAILDFDMFSKLTGKELKYESNDARKERLEESNGRGIQVKAFCFLTLNAEASFLLKFYDESINQNGTRLEIRGSIGAGFVLGASIGVDVWVFYANASAETSYGAVFHFSFDIVSEEMRIWHDQIGLKAEGSATTGAGISNGKSEEGRGGMFEGSYKSNDLTLSKDNKGISVEYEVISGSYKQKIEDDSWLAAKTYEDTPWVYQFGKDIKDQVEDNTPKGKFLSNMQLVIQFLYDHEGNNTNFSDYELRQKIEPRLQDAFDREIADLKKIDESLTQEDQRYITSLVLTELSVWHESRYSKFFRMPGYQQYYMKVRKSIIRLGQGKGMSIGLKSGRAIFE